MARRKREPMSEGKKNIIAELIEEYDIRTAKDIEDALRDLMGGTIQEIREAELDEHLGIVRMNAQTAPITATERKQRRSVEI